MNRRSYRIIMVLGLLLVSLGACSSLKSFFSTSGSRRNSGPGQVSELVGMIERVYVDAEVSKEKGRAAVAVLERIASSEFEGDPVSAYAELLIVIERSEKQAERLRASVEPMKRAAGPVFEQWEKDLDAFSTPELRSRSQARMAATRKRFDAIVVAVDAALADQAKLNSGLRDHALFLSHDFNPAALASLEDEVRALSELSGKLDGTLDSCLVTTRAYVEASSLPLGTVPARIENVGGKR